MLASDMNNWRDTLPDLLALGSYKTQGEIVAALAAQTGVAVNQATISRELNALRAEKVDGAYRLPAPPDLGAPVHRLLVTANGCLGVVKTDPAYASVIAQAIDGASLAGVLGTIAGDDTVFVALRDEAALPPLRRLLGLRSEEPRRTAA